MFLIIHAENVELVVEINKRHQTGLPQQPFFETKYFSDTHNLDYCRIQPSNQKK